MPKHIQVKVFDTCDYQQVYRVVERRLGKVYKTEDTGLVIQDKVANLLKPDFLGTSLSPGKGEGHVELALITPSTDPEYFTGDKP